MKTKVLMKSLIFGLTLSTSVFAGFGAGNGGLVIKCEDQAHYELADFYEVRTMKGLKQKMRISLDEKASYKEQFESAIIRLKQAISSFGKEKDPKIMSTLSLLDQKIESLNNIEWFYGNTSFPHTRDLGRFIIRDNCEEPVNAIAYYEKQVIDGQKRIFDDLHPTHKAGLFIHEVVYALTREMNTAETSLPARRMTALLFSDYKDNNYLLKNLVLEYLVLEKSKVMYKPLVTESLGKKKIEVFPIFECFNMCGSSVYLNGLPFNEVKRRRFLGSKIFRYEKVQELPALIEIWSNEIMPKEEIFIKNIRLNLKIEDREIDVPKVHKYSPSHQHGKFSLFFPLIDQQAIDKFLYPRR